MHLRLIGDHIAGARLMLRQFPAEVLGKFTAHQRQGGDKKRLAKPANQRDNRAVTGGKP